MSGLPPRIQAKFEEGNTFSSNKQWLEAINCYRQVLETLPRHEWALNNIGFCLWQAGEFEEAHFRLRQALSVGPNNVMALANLVSVMERLDLKIETIPLRRRIVELKPESSEHTFNLANMLLSGNRVEEALYYYRRTLNLDPHHAAAHCNYLLALNYSERETPEGVALEHFRFAQRWNVTRRTPDQFQNARDPDRILRLGYLSADFGQHPVGKLIGPLIAAHNKSEVEVFAYHDRTDEDPWTQKIRDACQMFHPVAELSDPDLKELILSDRIDLLIELGGYTGGRTRLAILAEGVAPLQLSFLGYPNTSGLSAMDYRLTDEYSDPTGLAERFYREKLFRLKRGFLCHAPPETYRP